MRDLHKNNIYDILVKYLEALFIGFLKWGIEILEAIGVQLSYGKNVILEDVDFSAPAASGTAVFGKNGSGKSTLLKALAGLLTPQKGTISLDGAPVAASLKRIGFVPQKSIAFEELTVLDNLLFWGAAYGLTKTSILNSPVIALLGLEASMKKKVSRLSGGMRKRCNIAASVLHEPDILILDEPFSEIDLVAKHELIDYLIVLKKMGKAFVITSHNPSELSALCENFRYIAGKRILEAEYLDGASLEENITNIIKRG